MTKKNYRKVNRAPTHPGRILESGFIEEYGLSIQTADLLGISRPHISRITNDHFPVTPASQWLTLQANYDAYVMAEFIE